MKLYELRERLNEDGQAVRMIRAVSAVYKAVADIMEPIRDIFDDVGKLIEEFIEGWPILESAPYWPLALAQRAPAPIFYKPRRRFIGKREPRCRAAKEESL